MKLKQLLLAMLIATPLIAQEPAPPDPPPPDKTVVEMKNVLDALTRLKISGYLQAQYVNDDRNVDQFAVRRGRLKFTYQASKHARMVVQPDFSSTGVTLKDAFVELTEPWTSWKHTVTAGQFGVPFGFELGYTSSLREVPERSRVVRSLFAGERDRGVMLSGTRKRFGYRVSVVNGNGSGSSSDNNDRKDLSARVGWDFGSVDAGLSTYQGTDVVAGREFDRIRYGGDVQWKTPVPGLALRGEYIRGRQTPSALAAATDADGWSLYVLQTVSPRQQLVLRVDEYDPNTGRDGDAVRTMTPSYVLQWDRHSKTMLAYEWAQNEQNDPDDNVLTVRYQFTF